MDTTNVKTSIEPVTSDAMAGPGQNPTSLRPIPNIAAPDAGSRDYPIWIIGGTRHSGVLTSHRQGSQSGFTRSGTSS